MQIRQVELSLDQAEAYDHVAALLRAAGVDLENNLLVPGRERDARVTALIGKAGSGKTLLLSELYHAMRRIGVDVVSGDYEPRRNRTKRSLAILAPTNKAASVLRMKGVPATTIHRILYTPVYDPEYEKIAKEYVARLPRGEVIDLFSKLSGPYAARGLAIVLGIDAATDDQMQRWSQALIDGAGNFGWKDEPFQRADRANEEMHRLFDSLLDRHRAKTNNSAMSVMLNADDPIEKKQIYANIKIAIGGGINEPRDALNTVLFGLLSNPEQLEEVKRNADWDKAFEEGIRWVAPISASSRLVVEDTEIRGCFIPKGDVVMTIQASANRDEDLFDDGESFFVYRSTNPHQSFGNGPHFCQGTHIARRAVAQVMLPILFDRFPNMSLPKPSAVNWRGFGFRGPLNLPVLLN